MTIPTDLRRCSGWYVLDGDGANYSGGELVDHSGKGNNLPLATGTPVWTTRDSVGCADFDATWYFEGWTVIPAIGSIVAKFHTDAISADANLDIVTTRKTAYGNDDHAAQTITGTWEANDRRFLRFAAAAAKCTIGDLVSGPGATSSSVLALNAWHTVTGVYNPAAKNVKIATGSDAVVTSVPDPFGSAPQYIDALIRIGYLKSAAWAGSPTRHFSLAEIAFFHDDILLNQSALAAALVASWA